MHSDTSKFATGSSLYQIQNGKPKLIAYASKRMPEAAKNYSITELEMCGLAITFASFAHLLKKVDFDAIVDHLAITHIMRSKAEPTTTRIKRLLELLSVYSFTLYYIKGKDMVLSDFLSRQKSDDSNPHDIIPISFSIRNVLHKSYYRLGSLKKLTDSRTDNYMVQTRVPVKSSSIKLLQMHGAQKNLVSHMKAENLVKGTWPIPHACHLGPIHHIPHTNQEPPTNTLPPIPNPGLGKVELVLGETQEWLHPYLRVTRHLLCQYQSQPQEKKSH